ncbi:MAG: sigma-70 family RNA polymerase sigma factor [Planctomycetes bacterium]|nr:sigma-70 family RNA polymerase sigma factor [Planctomycetota bacterium]
MRAPDDETRTLLEQWHGGDRQALATLVERDRRWVEDRVRRRRGASLRRLSETHDDVQELMVRALQYSPRFLCTDLRQFRALMARMIENLLIDRSRAAAARRQEYRLESFLGDSRITLDPALAGGALPIEAAERNEEMAWMRLGLEFLDPEERDLIWRRQLLEHSLAEIGADLQIAPDAVRMRFNRALLRLAGIVQRLQAGDLQELLGADAADGEAEDAGSDQ